MKKLYTIFAVLCTALALLTACSEEERDPVLPAASSWTAPKLTAGFTAGSSIVYEDNDKIFNKRSFKWDAAKFGLDIAVSYSLQIDLKGNNFSKAITLAAATGTSADVQDAMINKALRQLKVAEKATQDVELRVVATPAGAGFSATDKAISAAVALKITPTRNVLSIPLFMVGAFQGWNPDTAPLMEELPGGDYRIFVNLKDQYKFLPVRGSWAKNYGADGAGKIQLGGNPSNIVANDGIHMVLANTNDLTVKSVPVTFQLLGAAAPDGAEMEWSAGDGPTEFTAKTLLKPGKLKIKIIGKGVDLTLGGKDTDLVYDGAEFSAPATEGIYTVKLSLLPEVGYKITFTK